MAQRLRRLDLIFKRAPVYFVTACTAKRRSLLANELVHEAFKAFSESASKHGAWVGAYVLMPDHLHFFVAADDQLISPSAWVKSLKGTLSSRLRAAGVRPPSWQKGFFDHVLRSSDSYSAKWHYVRQNPVRAGLVRQWDQWSYAGEIFDLESRADDCGTL
jgi:REP-associated tyrosine transposase